MPNIPKILPSLDLKIFFAKYFRKKSNFRIKETNSPRRQHNSNSYMLSFSEHQKLDGLFKICTNAPTFKSVNKY
jgi:hypothetical protein